MTKRTAEWVMTGHPLAFSIMRLCGVKPEDAVGGKANWPEDYRPDYVENDDGTLRMRIALDGARDVQLSFQGGEARLSARDQTLPHLAATGIVGARLDQIVDHVLVNGRDHFVTAVESFEAEEGGIGTHFLIDGASTDFTATTER